MMMDDSGTGLSVSPSPRGSTRTVDAIKPEKQFIPEDESVKTHNSPITKNLC